MLSFSLSSIATSSEVDRVFQIMEIIEDFNLPISNKDVRVIAKGLYESQRSAKCKISWDILLAVAIKESKLDRRARSTPNYNGTRDHGLMQFNDATIKGMSLNRSRLIKDPSYSIISGCELLTDIKKTYSKKVPYWIGLYNAGVRLDKSVVHVNAKNYTKNIRKITDKIRYKARHLAGR